MKTILAFIFSLVLAAGAEPLLTVMVNTNGVVVKPANFQVANPPSGQGVASNYTDGVALSDSLINFYLPTGKRLANGSGALYFPTAVVNGHGFLADNNEDVYFGQNPADYSKKAFDHLGNWYFANGAIWGKTNGLVTFTNAVTATNAGNLFGGDGSRLTSLTLGSDTVVNGTVDFNGNNIDNAGVISANSVTASFEGDGSGISGINFTQLADIQVKSGEVDCIDGADTQVTFDEAWPDAMYIVIISNGDGSRSGHAVVDSLRSTGFIASYQGNGTSGDQVANWKAIRFGF